MRGEGFDDEFRATFHTNAPQEEPSGEFPELPLGVEAFRSPLHTLPVSPPKPRARIPRAAAAVGAVALLAALAGATVLMREPSEEVTVAREDASEPELIRAADAVPASTVPVAATAAIVALPELAAPVQPAVERAEAPVNKRVVKSAAAPSSTNKKRSRARAALPRTAAARRRASSAPKPIPELPSRSTVLAAMSVVKRDAQRCLSGDVVARVAITFEGATGKVSATKVSGASGSAASCLASAIRRAKLPQFQRNQLDITFPFRAGG